MLKFKIGQVVYDLEEQRYERIESVRLLDGKDYYRLAGDIGVDYPENLLRSLTTAERGGE